MVRWVAVLIPGLLVVVGFTEWLPVALVPEQRLVTTVWDNVIHNSGSLITPFFQALHAQWVFPQICFACPLPLAGVAAAGC